MLLSATNRLGSSRWVKSPASVRIVAQHASVAVPRSRPHLCGGVVTGALFFPSSITYNGEHPDQSCERAMKGLCFIALQPSVGTTI
jgi:hypothetical protein